MKQIQLYTRFSNAITHFALVDDEDFELLNKFSWYLKLGNDNKLFYARATIGPNTRVFMHDMIKPNSNSNLSVDHKDRNGLNNQKENLRLATVAQQNINRKVPSNNTSNYKGVHYDKKLNAWMARISIDSKRKYLGCYKTPNKAARAYNKAALEHFGEFALLNIIVEEQIN